LGGTLVLQSTNGVAVKSGRRMTFMRARGGLHGTFRAIVKSGFAGTVRCGRFSCTLT